MNKVKLAAVLSLFVSGGAFAQDPGTQASVYQKVDTDMTLKEEVIGVIPQVGVVGFIDGSGTRQARGVAGMGFEFSLAPLVGDGFGKDYFLGVSTGAFYSHMGSTNSNFFGANDNTQPNGSGANLLLIPADLKLGYNFTRSFRGSLHGGGNVIYRSAASAAELGAGSGSNDSLWKIYPNVGADLEVQLGPNVALIARPDVTITTGTTVLMGTLGATFIPSM